MYFHVYRSTKYFLVTGKQCTLYRGALQENRTNLRFEDYTKKLCSNSNTQAGGYLAEPQSLEQMEFLAGIAGLESDFTGIRNLVLF